MTCRQIDWDDAQSHAHEARIAKAALDAARKRLWDCREREGEAFTTYIEAMTASSAAFERERNAFYKWCDSSRKLTTETAP
jgi:hypothetical protein